MSALPRTGPALSAASLGALTLLAAAAAQAQPAPAPAAVEEAPTVEEAPAAPVASDVEILRTATRMLFGAGVVGGSTAFSSTPLVVEADIGQIPSIMVGIRTWPEDYAGFQLAYQGGFFGGVEVTQLSAEAGSATLDLTHHRIEGDFRYRYFTSPRLDALELTVRGGFLLHTLSPSDHSPNLLVSTTYFGPLLGLAVKLPFSEGDLGVEAEGAVTLPFFVRESPVSSGVPDGATGYHVGLAPYYRVTRSLFLALRFDLRAFSAEFSEEGERYGGVTGASREDLFYTAQAQLEWAL